MIAELLIAGAQWGVKLFIAAVVFIILSAVLFILLYIAAGMIAGESKEDEKG